MPSNIALAKIARSLSRAHESHRAIAAPSETYPELTIDDAYGIQLLQVKAWVAAGAVVCGYKIGLTSKAMQEQFGVSQPDFGHLFRSTLLPEDTKIDASAYLQPKVEPEIALVLGRELKGPGVTVAQAVDAVDHVLPSLELIDSRIRNWQFTIVDTIADNAAAAGVILGAKPTKLDDVDLGAVECRLQVDSLPVLTGLGSAAMGTPINALVWLANTLGARGVAFSPGDVIMPGSLTAAQPVRAGTVARADFKGLGSVTAYFA